MRARRSSCLQEQVFSFQPLSVCQESLSTRAVSPMFVLLKHLGLGYLLCIDRVSNWANLHKGFSLSGTGHDMSNLQRPSQR